MRDRILGNRAANAQQRASQRVKEVCKSFVPSVWVVQVTGVACSLHHHHFVIGQIAQVTERHLPKLMVLVTVNDQRWDLDTKITTIMKKRALCRVISTVLFLAFENLSPFYLFLNSNP